MSWPIFPRQSFRDACANELWSRQIEALTDEKAAAA
jgi:hypothetical protein